MPEKQLVYVISPVRQVSEEQAESIHDYVSGLEKVDDVFNPVRDAPQSDQTGYRIVTAELAFLNKAAQKSGRVDVFWTKGANASEGSRVDLGIALSLRAAPDHKLDIKLVKVFNENNLEGPQVAWNLLLETCAPKSMGDLSLTTKFKSELQRMVNQGSATINWDIAMANDVQEWQRLTLGGALGCAAVYPNFRISLGHLRGEDVPNKKSYPKVIREFEQHGFKS